MSIVKTTIQVELLVNQTSADNIGLSGWRVLGTEDAKIYPAGFGGDAGAFGFAYMKLHKMLGFVVDSYWYSRDVRYDDHRTITTPIGVGDHTFVLHPADVNSIGTATGYRSVDFADGIAIGDQLTFGVQSVEFDMPARAKQVENNWSKATDYEVVTVTGINPLRAVFTKSHAKFTKKTVRPDDPPDAKFEYSGVVLPDRTPSVYWHTRFRYTIAGTEYLRLGRMTGYQTFSSKQINFLS